MKRSRNGFTLIEVLIVVVIMAVLAATIIPQFASSADDAKDSALSFNIHTIQSQIEMYKINHGGTPPSLDKFADQMTGKTNSSGDTSGTNLVYGPYLQGEIPANPFNGDNTVVGVASEGEKPTAVNGDTGGWQYDETTGDFYPNNAEYFEEEEVAEPAT